MRFVRSEDSNESDICTKITPEGLLKKQAMNIRNITMRSWRDYEITVKTAVAVWRENVKIQESNEPMNPGSWSVIVRLDLRSPACANRSIAVEYDWNR
jgi:hypothetical protein